MRLCGWEYALYVSRMLVYDQTRNGTNLLEIGEAAQMTFEGDNASLSGISHLNEIASQSLESGSDSW
jgi:hypothetical protein